MHPGCNEIKQHVLEIWNSLYRESKDKGQKCSEIKPKQCDQEHVPPQFKMQHGQNSFAVYKFDNCIFFPGLAKRDE